MKDIEKRISPLIENQFPSFYQEEGENFIAFVKAYYEWMEQEGGVLNEARSLSEYRDIDSTTDEFIVNFKEKYLKNIQFDTATNKKLLVKNSLDLYRSKGTERSIDLFFKLVYGTSAEVRYPAEKVFRLSDGVYEVPEYLEIGYSIFNIDYVGKQIIGQLSGAKAFVEKYIRRRAGSGYVNLLYISGRQGEFRNGEVIGINVNNVPTYDPAKRSLLIGSLKRVTVESRGRDFRVGDIVQFKNSDRGLGGLARVASVQAEAGVVDFIFVDGGYGYTLTADSIVSEKVLNLDNVTVDYTEDGYFNLFERGIQPVINVGYSATTSNVAVGNTVYRYAANGDLAAEGIVLEVDPSSNTNGFISISHTRGVFVPGETYYTVSNAISFTADTVEDKSLAGKFMNFPTDYNITVSNVTGTFAVGDTVQQINNDSIIGSAQVANVLPGNILSLTNARGVFKNSKRMADWNYTAGTGTITTTTTSNVVTGVSTAFSNNYLRAKLYDDGNVELGTVASVINSTSLTLTTTATANVSGNTHSYGLPYFLYNSSNTAINANVEIVSFDAGLYDIRKHVYNLEIDECSSNGINYANNIYIYNAAGNLVSEGLVLTVDYDNSTNTGNVTFISRKGYWRETETVYTEGNTDNFKITSFTVDGTGGDYVRSYPSRIIAPTTNTVANITSISFGSGAGFGVGTIGESEVIFIGTDLINANGVDTLDYSRFVLTVTSNSGFDEGQRVYQEIQKVSFNPSTAVDTSNGFITITDANTYFIAGDQVTYSVAAGNTPLTPLVNNNIYHVRFSNSTGLILSQVYDKTTHINSTSYPGETFANSSFDIPAFADNAVNESGHFIYKTAHATLYDVDGTNLYIKDPIRDFGLTQTSTEPTNSNIIVYGDDTVNTDISATGTLATISQANQVFASELIAADAFGFPKNPQGNYLDILYSCLSFGRFEIGIIGSLNQINPGEDYNVPPFVLAHQPYIAGFDRKDLIITYENATRSFISGEIINQIQANLQFYDLQVTSGAFSNTYDGRSISVQTQYEVDGTNEFIYYRDTSTTFNATDEVNTNTNFIKIDGNDYSANDLVRYFTDSGNTTLTGLTNNQFYYVLTSNSTGITLTTEAGNTLAIVDITQSSNVAEFNSNTDVQSSTDFINITSADTIFANGDQVRYLTTTTPVNGLTNNSIYYVRYANSTGLALSVNSISANIDIIGLNPGSDGHFLRYYDENADGHNIRSYVNQFANGSTVQYRIPSGNTVISGLTDLGVYYIVGANNVGFKLSSTSGGSAIDITANSTGGESHNISSLPGYLPKDKVYQNVGGSVTNAIVSSVFSNTIGDFVRITANTDAITNNEILFSYTVPTVNGNVTNVFSFETVSIAKAIVKSANATHIQAKRITFENTWEPEGTVVGTVSGAEADVIAAVEDQSELYPIGLNAEITANVVTANGQVTSLQVFDSGFAYANGEIIDFVSEDNLRAGTAKVVIDGHGVGRGFYRSSKGFLSDDIYVHDSDYYQEYSYEVLSKLSIDRYADMFKKVMHTAGSNFFGSPYIVEEESVTTSLSSIATSNKIRFNTNSDTVSSADDSIRLNIQDGLYTFEVQDVDTDIDFIDLTSKQAYSTIQLAVNDYVQYITTDTEIGVGESSNLSNNNFYYVVFANSSGVKISETLGGDPLNLNTSSIGDTLELHTFTRVINPFANGDIVRYTTTTGNVALEASVTGSFVTNTGVVVDSFIRVANNKFRNSDYVNVTFDSATCNTQSFNANTSVDVDGANSANIYITITSHPFANGDSILYYTGTGNTAIRGLTNNQIYYVIQTTTNTLKLATQAGNTASIANIVPSSISESGHFIMRGFNGITNTTSYYVMDANTSGFRLSTTGARPDIISFKSSNTGLTLNLSQTKLTNTQTYYIVNTTPNTVKLSLTANGSPINITANTTGSGSDTAGHYLTKTVEE